MAQPTRFVLAPAFEGWLESALHASMEIVSFGTNEWEVLEAAGRGVKPNVDVTVCFYASRSDRRDAPSTISFVAKLVGTTRGDGSTYAAPQYRPPLATEQGDSNCAVYYAVRELRRLERPIMIAAVMKTQPKRHDRSAFADNFVPRRPIFIDDPGIPEPGN